MNIWTPVYIMEGTVVPQSAVQWLYYNPRQELPQMMKSSDRYSCLNFVPLDCVVHNKWRSERQMAIPRRLQWATTIRLHHSKTISQMCKWWKRNTNRAIIKTMQLTTCLKNDYTEQQIDDRPHISWVRRVLEDGMKQWIHSFMKQQMHESIDV